MEQVLFERRTAKRHVSCCRLDSWQSWTVSNKQQKAENECEKKLKELIGWFQGCECGAIQLWRKSGGSHEWILYSDKKNRVIQAVDKSRKAGQKFSYFVTLVQEFNRLIDKANLSDTKRHPDLNTNTVGRNRFNTNVKIVSAANQMEKRQREWSSKWWSLLLELDSAPKNKKPAFLKAATPMNLTGRVPAHEMLEQVM